MFESLTARLKGLKIFPRGVHPAGNKSLAAEKAIRALPLPETLVIPLHQHIGAPCEATVKPREDVQYGQKIADSGSPVSAPIHASAAGKTAGLQLTWLPDGRKVQAIPIAAEKMETDVEGVLGLDLTDFSPEKYDPDQIRTASRDAGLVGMGGAAFPTHIKLRVPKDKPIDTVIINGSECEPYLTADYRLMLEYPDPIVAGLLLGMRAVGAEKGIIAIENNKPKALASMRQSVERVGAAVGKVEVVACATKYPMGGERQLIQAVLGRIVPAAPKGLPLDVGVVVLNVGTASALARMVIAGRPLTHRVVTITGRGVREPGNWLVAIGTPVENLIAAAGGMTPQAARVVGGGPMMGQPIANLAAPVTKGTSGISVFTDKELSGRTETNCIRCGRCVEQCPLNLTPTKIAHAVKFRDLELAEKYNLMVCIECGCCTYGCPAGIPLVQYMKSGKRLLREKK